MESKIEMPQGLTLESGLSQENIFSSLENLGLEFRSTWEKPKKEGYFRSSYFQVNSFKGIPFSQFKAMPLAERDRIIQGVEDKIIDTIGYPQHINFNTLSYFAEYSIDKDFDWSVLTGKITFNGGRLVERVRLCVSGQCF